MDVILPGGCEMPVIYLNGKFVEHMEAALDPLDRGVLLGDGIFETLRFEQGQLLFHLAHFARLGRNARLMEIPWNMPSDDLLAISQQCIDANNLELGRLRVTLTRGELGASPEISATTTAPTLIVNAQPIDQVRLDEGRRNGWSATVVRFPINHRSPIAEVKSTSYQEHLLARLFARREGFNEGLLLNTDGLLAEGAMCNLFIVREGAVLTPPVEDGAMPGIVRLKIGLICARLSMEYREESLTLEDLYGADEAFLTSSVMEVMPLVRVEQRTIGTGEPGPTTMRLYKEHRRDIEMFLSAMRGN